MLPEDSMLRRHYLTEQRYKMTRELHPELEKVVAKAEESLPLATIVTGVVFFLFVLMIL
jgi:hypothetical protein